MNKKTVAIILAVVLVCVGAIGGTLAWLTDSKEVTNTFTVGDIEIALDEDKFDASKANLVPGTEIDKDPTITVKANSEDSYVFAMVENNLKANGKTIGELNISSDWTAVATQGNKTIYKYKETILSQKSDKELTSIFTKVSIDGDKITSEDLEAMEKVTNKTIVVNAYAHQVTSQTEEQALEAFKTLLGGTWA